ncbi:ML2 [Symbiodinium sp. CCMP2456]|nr:ML2 [Symbiodinium sp. CCMP2456]
MARSVSLSDASNTVAVHFQTDCPRNLDEATALFSRFGDIARLDTTLGAVTGLVFVTFFDVRVAQKVLQHFGALAEPFQPAAYDFRAVSIAPHVIADLPDQFGQLHSFGEIAGVSLCGEEIVVEFYDMRAAQQVTFFVPASRPRRQVSQTAGQGQGQAQVQNGQIPVPRSPLATDWVQETLSASKAFSLQGAVPGSPPLTGKESEPPTTPPSKSGPKWQGPGKPVREKVRMEDLLKFDIVPEKIQSGEDTRTTVMVRNIPKACTREAFVELLNPCGLSDRYTFFYMPFDKRRNMHCGFAFINFRTPSDVLVLWQRMTPSFWRAYLKRGHVSASTLPAVSYARLQGQEQLTKHFSLSAVMRDSDARKRPVFCQKNNVFHSEEAIGEALPHELQAESGQFNLADLQRGPLHGSGAGFLGLTRGLATCPPAESRRALRSELRLCLCQLPYSSRTIHGHQHAGCIQDTPFSEKDGLAMP